MSDEVRVHGLKIEAPVGVFEFEKGTLQTLRFDLVCGCDLRKPGASDHIADAINYDGLSEVARSVCRSRHHDLIESIAAEVAAGILSASSAVNWVEVTVHKPGAVPDAADVSVRIKRSRGSASAATR
ncbi:MAG: dihydroneopterin aldolase [Myxococcota bacterium]